MIIIDLVREIKFALTECAIRYVLLGVVILSSFSLFSGFNAVEQQRMQLKELKAEAAEDQSYVLAKQSSAGAAAYYSFHLTYDPPSPLAYLALGLRDELPWKHRIRMLALEGQIYENDPGNSELSYLGKLDFAFLVAFVLPLLVIGLLYDLDARERRQSRYELLLATSKIGSRIILLRAFAHSLLLFVATLVPFFIAALSMNILLVQILKIGVVVALYILFWLVVCRVVTHKNIEGITAAVILLGIWILLTTVVPVTGKFVVEHMVQVPNGGDILLTQREAVNDAWDLPKDDTMTPFFETHPQWQNTKAIKKPFEWKWYYAFQQVGDQQTESLSTDLYRGISLRDKWMGKISILSPPLSIWRWFNQQAKTDTLQHLHYVECMRKFHSKLRAFYYPMLFGDQDYSANAMSQLPQFESCSK